MGLEPQHRGKKIPKAFGSFSFHDFVLMMLLNQYHYYFIMLCHCDDKKDFSAALWRLLCHQHIFQMSALFCKKEETNSGDRFCNDCKVAGISVTVIFQDQAKFFDIFYSSA